MSRVVDTVVLAVVNAGVYLRHPRNVRLFRQRVGYYPDVARPVRYNEMMLWRKVFDHNPAFVTFCDKLATKRYIGQRCPDLLLPTVVWTGRDIATMPPDTGRGTIVKSNAGCNQSVVVQDVSAVPRDRLERWLGTVYGQRYLEWAYAFAERTLLAEEPISDENGELIDLSVHAVDGVPVFMEAVLGNKTRSARKGYFRPDGTRWPEIERKGREGLPADYSLPRCYPQALEHARVLGAGVDYVRVDFMVAGDRLHAGEITVYPGSGLTRHADFLTYNAVLAQHWDLSKAWFLTASHQGFRRLYSNALHRSLMR